MKTHNTILTLLFPVLLFSCKKDPAETTEKQPYVQYFKADVAGQSLDIKGSNSTNREIFRGSRTIIGDADGTQHEMYTVNVALQATVLNTTSPSKLQFQIFDIRPKEYQLANGDAYQKNFSTHIFLVTDLGRPDSKLYTTSAVKSPFHIVISKYDMPKDSGIPFVGGKLDGVLYNVKNLQDSIVIRNGVFDVRF
ncbi:DUF5025 domain-containing protein [Pedobacter frigidisoli]|uniref:DUF5025 domain-containing protein n=1 Tax=Pedobacter frigidisoli TaxID=2530455 RepID=UPI00292CF99D|nr:DUF5025 domain-containing protein [Pedobacter frigidisoli]